MLIRTKGGELALSADGVVFKPAAFHGPQVAEVWPWPEVRRVTVAGAVRSGDRLDFGLLGVVGLLIRRHEVAVTVTLADQDMTWYTRQPLPEVAAAARRVRDNVTEAADKIIVET